MVPFKRKLLVLAILGAAAAHGEDAREIVRKSLDHDERSERIARNYTYLEHDVLRQVDDQGAVKSTRSRTFDVTVQEESPYRRLVARDGKPLSASDEAAEKAKLERSIEERRRESPSQRAKRLAEWEKRRERQRKILREIPDAFQFTLAGDARIDGREVWVIRAAPRPDYHGRTFEGRLLTKFAGTLWIDKTEYQWVKVEATAVETVSFGWVLARMAKGASLEVVQTRVNDEVWLPRHVLVTYRARIGLVKKISGQSEITYSGYRKFQAESRLVPDGSAH
jgi:hypothetical protein